MNLWNVAWRGSKFHWRSNLAVAIGVAAGTAVLTGALIVGDSVRTSLKSLTLERLGKIDVMVLGEQFFRTELAEETSEALSKPFKDVVPAIVFPSVALEHRADDTHRVRGVTVVGCTSKFWKHASVEDNEPPVPGFDEIVLNQPLADELRAKVGDSIIVRLAESTGIAADSVLARQDELTTSLANLKVIAILPAEGLARFGLHASQSSPLTAFLGLDVVQDALDEEGKCNALMITGNDADRAPTDDQMEVLRQSLRPTLEDVGVQLKQVLRTWRDGSADAPEQVAYEYFNLSTDRMLFPSTADEALASTMEKLNASPVLTYSANLLQKDGATDDSKGIPYSIVTAVDSSSELSPLRVDGEPIEIADDEIVVTSWAAEDQDLDIGDQVRVTYYEPETTHGEVSESSAVLTVKAIVPLVEPAQPFEGDRPALFTERPTLATDPDFTPVVEGVSDQDSIRNWDAPFPVNMDLIRDQDDEFWKRHRTTPKAFVSLAAGRKLWGSRFGETTSYRIPVSPDADEAKLRGEIRSALHAKLTSLGFLVMEVKKDGLAASQGTTPFNLLFIGFSFFIIAAALMLVSLLFRLGMEQRSDELGIMLAQGLRPTKAASMFVGEGLITTVVGCVIGCVVGVAYASLMIAGLRSWWLDAVVTPFLQMHVSPLTLIVGLLAGVLISLMTIAWTAWRMSRRSARQLLAGDVDDSSVADKSGKRWIPIVSVALLVIAVLAAFAAQWLSGEMQALAFFGGGSCVLCASLHYIWFRLRRRAKQSSDEAVSLGLLATRNLSRNPLRSALTIGLMAAACFLIVAISAFRLQPTESGVGGFDLICESDHPVFVDLDNTEARQDAFGDDIAFADTRILSLRVRDGDDASCRNLYQAQRPRLLGVPESMMAYFDDTDVPKFEWMMTSSTKERPNPWRALNADGDADVIPVIIDKNTAMYGLHLYGGVGEEFELEYDDGPPVRFRVVGLLSNTILQGSLLVAEDRLMERFRRVGGYRLFLFRGGNADEISTQLEEVFSDQGFDAQRTSKVLADLLAVQNTYLSTFQSLGGLGLLLGTFGLAAVQLRNVVERRRELAVMRAAGFRLGRISRLVLLEHALLLLAGLGVGLVAALVAVLPHLLAGGASVPWTTLLVTLAVVLVVGLLTGLVAVRGATKIPVLSALRGQ